ncbi:MAG TPA: ATP-binding protein [Burkholderiales bacterium]|jgi:signal transduction histidine kinase|nr:ATP-binding protein [Burkholderiales bacterium]
MLMFRRAPTIGVYLVALILAAVVPLALSAAYLVARQAEIQREAFEQTQIKTAAALSVAVDRQLDSHVVMLETLAQEDSLQRGDLATFARAAARVAEQRGAVFISLFERDGRQVFNTLKPVGAPLPTPYTDPRTTIQGAEKPPVGDPSALQEVLRSGKPAVSGLLYGLVAQRLIFTVNVPVRRNGKVAQVLNAAFAPEVMTRLLRDNSEFKDAPAVIFDSRGFIVGRWQSAERYTGSRISPDALAIHLESDKRTHAGSSKTREGIEVYYSYARSPMSGWGVTVGTDRAAFDAAMRRNWQVGAILAAGGLLAGLLLAMWLAARLRGSIRGLAAVAEGKAPSSAASLPTREVGEVGRALAQAAAEREARASERESRRLAEMRKEDAERESRAKDRFIAVLSHELRNPLAPIRNGIAILRHALARGRPPDDSILDVLERQSEQLTRLVSDLLDVSRISSGKMTLVRERVDLADVASHAAESAAPGLAARGQHFTRDLGRDAIVDGDFARLSQIASNLLDNAIKYTPEGGHISITVRAEGDQSLLSVQDNGRGLDAGGAAFPAPSSDQQRLEGGLGLGLSLARSLTELHGGTLEARSSGPGRGSTFTLRLPRVLEARPPKQTDAFAGRGGHSRRVLVVDDNPDVAQTTASLLKTLGHEAHVQFDGKGALEAAARLDPEIVLLDIGMPGMDGYEVARRLRKDARRPPRIIAMSGWGQEADRQKSSKAGIELHLVKPVRVEDLVAALL